MYSAVAAKVAVGKVSPVELARMEVSLAAAKRAERLASRQKELSQTTLSSFWGGSASEIAVASDALDLPTKLPSAPDKNKLLALQKLQAELMQQEKKVTEATLGGMPDVTLSVGLKREAITGNESLQVGASFPLPLFNRNQSERRVAKASRERAAANLEANTIQLTQELNRLVIERESSFDEVQRLHDLLQIGEKTVSDLQEGYAAGKFSLMDLLDGQRALMDMQAADIAAHVLYQKSDAALNEMVGAEYVEVQSQPLAEGDK